MLAVFRRSDSFKALEQAGEIVRIVVANLIADGFDVYISADHGNTACVGLGRIMGSGVEVETKSHKMVVLKDFADKESLIQKYGLIEYPKYYLPKE